jgi:hypothetical protein
VTLGGDGKAGRIHLAGAGVNSEDGFSGYPNLAFAVPCFAPVPGQDQLCETRWGDYGATAIGDDGSIWLANRYIGPRPGSALANWGTFITRLKEDDN